MSSVGVSRFPKEKLDRLRARFSELILDIKTEGTDDPVITVAPDKILDFLAGARREEGFEYNFLADLTAYDFAPPVEEILDYGLGNVRSEAVNFRFYVVYQLLSMQNKDRIRVRVPLKEGEEIPTAVGLWLSANWLEREIFDLYGIRFKGHPNLRRIMLDDRWVGHPLRKDYPIKRYQRFEDSLEMSAVGLEE